MVLTDFLYPRPNPKYEDVFSPLFLKNINSKIGSFLKYSFSKENVLKVVKSNKIKVKELKIKLNFDNKNKRELRQFAYDNSYLHVVLGRSIDIPWGSHTQAWIRPNDSI